MKKRNWQVLVVEDEYDSIQMVSKILRFYGIEVTVAHNGHECLEMIEQVKPTLIVTDLAMPGMDGWATLQAVRANPNSDDIPMVAITAYHSPLIASEALRAGFNAFFIKPIDPRTFVDELERIIDA